MQDKKILMCYRPGARGDFMMSLMSGSIREVYTDLFALPQSPNCIKMHDFGDIWYGDTTDVVNTINDFARYRAFRIKIEDFEDAKFITYLMHYKMPFAKGVKTTKVIDLEFSVAYSLINCLQFETKFRQHDIAFEEVVPFKNVFDFDFLMGFCARHSEQIWTEEDLSKIAINIKINQQLKEQMNQFYNDKFIASVEQAYKEVRSNKEQFLEFPDTVDFLSDWEFVNGR